MCSLYCHYSWCMSMPVSFFAQYCGLRIVAGEVFSGKKIGVWPLKYWSIDKDLGLYSGLGYLYVLARFLSAKVSPVPVRILSQTQPLWNAYLQRAGPKLDLCFGNLSSASQLCIWTWDSSQFPFSCFKIAPTSNFYHSLNQVWKLWHRRNSWLWTCLEDLLPAGSCCWWRRSISAGITILSRIEGGVLYPTGTHLLCMVVRFSISFDSRPSSVFSPSWLPYFPWKADAPLIYWTEDPCIISQISFSHIDSTSVMILWKQDASS